MFVSRELPSKPKPDSLIGSDPLSFVSNLSAAEAPRSERSVRETQHLNERRQLKLELKRDEQQKRDDDD